MSVSIDLDLSEIAASLRDRLFGFFFERKFDRDETPVIMGMCLAFVAHDPLADALHDLFTIQGSNLSDVSFIHGEDSLISEGLFFKQVVVQLDAVNIAFALKGIGPAKR